MVGATSSTKKRTHRRGAPKPKMTKEERRAKYTQLARDREGRRRRQENSRDLVCYQCRQRGHGVADCPNTNSKKQKKQNGARICYKCGSTEHPLSKCPKRNDGSDELPFCHCFICNEMGHLSSKCPKNEHGIFINGGECKNCGSNLHLSSDCPQKEDDPEKKERKSFTGEPDIDPSTLLATEGGGDELAGTEKERNSKQKLETEKDGKKKKKQRRVVNF